MKNKLIFRIIGALASALIIVSVFIPFISVTGYSTSLWESYKIINSLYLPIMIIVFGAIGVLFFALNIKTEFAYMSTGAIIFFLVMQTIDVLNQGLFNTLSIGYYLLALGAILTGIMAFLTNLKTKVKEEKVEVVDSINETSMLDQIDKLYNDQPTVQNEISPIQPVDNVVEPIPIQPLEQIQPISPMSPIPEVQQVVPDVSSIPVQPTQEVIPEPTQSVEIQPSLSQVTPVVPVQETQVVEQPINPVAEPVVAPQPKVQIQQVNPVIQEFTQPTVNPVVQEFTQQTSPNPVVQDFSIHQENVQPTIQNESVEEIQPLSVPLSNINNSEANNPVVQEFTNPGSTVSQTQNTNSLDIFGQPK